MDSSTLNDHDLDPSLRSGSQSLFPLPLIHLHHQHDHDDDDDVHQDQDHDMDNEINNNNHVTHFQHQHQHQHQHQTELDQVTASAITASLSHPLPHSSLGHEDDIDHNLNNNNTNTDNDNHEIDQVNVTDYLQEEDFAKIPGMTESSAIISPSPHLAPFSRPMRDEATPHPLYLQFPDRVEFEGWLKGESSWCHYVQRRSTTPEKRAEERLKAREKAYERIVSGLSEEQAASTPPLKRRRRIRTSSILEKVTYTCHHAGKYSSKHSETLPQAKLRLNTKKTVKCDCTSRIVLNEMESGLCKVVYFWKHERHDPFADNEHNSGRLPKVIDDWLIAQIEAGRDTESIRKSLQISEEEKEAYLQRAAADPQSITPDMPPPLAFSLKIKYPDIYNRYRKLKGPIKSTKILKTRRTKADPNDREGEGGEYDLKEDTYSLGDGGSAVVALGYNDISPSGNLNEGSQIQSQSQSQSLLGHDPNLDPVLAQAQHIDSTPSSMNQNQNTSRQSRKRGRNHTQHQVQTFHHQQQQHHPHQVHHLHHPEQAIYHPDFGSSQLELGTSGSAGVEVEMDADAESLPEGLAELASQGHEGLARALLHLPRSGMIADVEDGNGDSGQDEIQLSEEVLRIADVVVDNGGEGVEHQGQGQVQAQGQVQSLGHDHDHNNISQSGICGEPGTAWEALGI